jgi:hypothetical protein
MPDANGLVVATTGNQGLVGMPRHRP